MEPYKIAFIVDEAAVNTFESEYVLVPLFRNLVCNHEQVTLFFLRGGTEEELCACVDDADAVFCYLSGDGNASSAVRYAEEQGKDILHLEPSEEEKAFIRAKHYERRRREILFFD